MAWASLPLALLTICSGAGQGASGSTAEPSLGAWDALSLLQAPGLPDSGPAAPEAGVGLETQQAELAEVRQEILELGVSLSTGDPGKSLAETRDRVLVAKRDLRNVNLKLGLALNELATGKNTQTSVMQALGRKREEAQRRLAEAQAVAARQRTLDQRLAKELAEVKARAEEHRQHADEDAPLQGGKLATLQEELAAKDLLLQAVGNESDSVRQNMEYLLSSAEAQLEAAASDLAGRRERLGPQERLLGALAKAGKEALRYRRKFENSKTDKDKKLVIDQASSTHQIRSKKLRTHRERMRSKEDNVAKRLEALDSARNSSKTFIKKKEDELAIQLAELNDTSTAVSQLELELQGLAKETDAQGEKSRASLLQLVWRSAEDVGRAPVLTASHAESQFAHPRWNLSKSVSVGVQQDLREAKLELEAMRRKLSRTTLKRTGVVWEELKDVWVGVMNGLAEYHKQTGDIAAQIAAAPKETASALAPVDGTFRNVGDVMSRDELLNLNIWRFNASHCRLHLELDHLNGACEEVQSMLSGLSSVAMSLKRSVQASHNPNSLNEQRRMINFMELGKKFADVEKHLSDTYKSTEGFRRKVLRQGEACTLLLQGKSGFHAEEEEEEQEEQEDGEDMDEYVEPVIFSESSRRAMDRYGETVASLAEALNLQLTRVNVSRAELNASFGVLRGKVKDLENALRSKGYFVASDNLIYAKLAEEQKTLSAVEQEIDSRTAELERAQQELNAPQLGLAATLEAEINASSAAFDQAQDEIRELSLQVRASIDVLEQAVQELDELRLRSKQPLQDPADGAELRLASVELESKDLVLRSAIRSYHSAMDSRTQELENVQAQLSKTKASSSIAGQLLASKEEEVRSALARLDEDGKVLQKHDNEDMLSQLERILWNLRKAARDEALAKADAEAQTAQALSVEAQLEDVQTITKKKESELSKRLAKASNEKFDLGQRMSSLKYQLSQKRHQWKKAS